MGSCDAEIAAQRFGEGAWRFRIQHYPHLIERYPDEGVDALFRAIAPPPASTDASGAG